VLITGIAVTCTCHADCPQAVKPKDKNNESHGSGMLACSVTTASFLTYLDTVNNTNTEDFEKDMQGLKMKYSTIERSVEALRQEFWRITNHLNTLDSSYQGVQYNHSFQ